MTLTRQAELDLIQVVHFSFFPLGLEIILL